MALIYPKIECGEARAILAAMRKLKSRRYNHEISRLKFLTEWEKLRTLLSETDEYKALRRKCIARAGGVCEKCKAQPGSQMCHKMSVAVRPDLALRIDNVYWGCQPCHQLDHPDLQLAK